MPNYIKKKNNLLQEQHRAAQTTSAVQEKCKQSDEEVAPHPHPLMTLVLLDGQQEKAESRVGSC